MKAARPGLFVHLSVVLVSSLLIAGCAGLSSRTSSATLSPAPGATPSPVPTPESGAKFIYSIVNAEVTGFAVQPDGEVQAIPGLPSPQPLNKTQLVVSPDGMWLFTITGCAPDPDRCPFQGGAVFNQSIHSDGKLGAPTMVIPTDQKTIALVVDQTSHFVYALSEIDLVPPFDPDLGCSGTLQVLTAYAIGADGGLVPLNSKVTTVNGETCSDTSIFPETTLIGFHQDTTGNYLWLTQSLLGRNIENLSLISIPVAADGTLGVLTETLIGGSMTEPATSVIAGQFMVNSEDEFEGVTVATYRLQNGRFQFAWRCSTDVSACNALTIAVSPSGKVVYTVSGDFIGGWTVNALTLDATTGELVPFGKSIALPQGAITPPDLTLMPVLATVDSQGSFLFVSRSGDATITTIALDPITGELGTSVDFAVGAPPNAIVSVTK